MEPVNVDPLKFDIIFIWIVGGDLYFSNVMYLTTPQKYEHQHCAHAVQRNSYM